MKRLRTCLFLLFPLLLCLAGCGNQGKLDEGDCAGVVLRDFTVAMTT